jgi:hypothetical protein
MAKLTNLKLEEFSIVRGSDKQPANPGAKTLAYKSVTNKESDMQKSISQAAPEKPKSLAEKVTDAVRSVMGKATTTRTFTSDYTSQSQSRSTETVEDAQTPGAEPGEGGATVIVVEATQKSEPAESAEQPTGGEEAITKAIAAGMAPLMKQLDNVNSRLVLIEKGSAGSKSLALGKSLVSPQVEDNSGMQFPQFTKFLTDVSKLSPGQKLTKATISSSGWTYGLSTVEAGTFIDYIIDLSVLLKKIRTVKMPDKKFKIDKIGLGGKVLVKATPGTDPGDTVSVSGPTQVELDSSEVIAIVSIGDDTLEDNIEGDAFVQHLLRMVSAAASNELEQAAIHGDTAVADTGILDRWDGFYKLAKANGAQVIEAMADTDRYWPGTAGAKATKLIKKLPVQFRQDYRTLGMILHNDLYLDYQDELSTKGYSEAWGAITGALDVPIRSIPNIRVPMIKTDMSFTYSATPYTDGTVVMLSDLRNLIFGVHREIKIEPFRQPRKRCTDYVISMRAAVQIEHGAAIAIYDHAKVKP